MANPCLRSLTVRIVFEGLVRAAAGVLGGKPVAGEVEAAEAEGAAAAAAAAGEGHPRVRHAAHVHDARLARRLELVEQQEGEVVMRQVVDLR